MHVNVCDMVYVLAGVLQCKGGNLEEAEDFKFVFVIYCALKRNRSAPVRDLLCFQQLRYDH